jgi:AraC-like DNA-binding protein/quercetin dioxygenase-like cupin family protein
VRKTVARFAGGDIASELLRDVRIESSVLCRSVMAAPWGFGVAGKDLGSFHMVLSGRGILEVDGTAEPVSLGPGDVVVLPTGDAHWVKDAPTTRAPWLTSILDRHGVVDGELRFGGDDGPTTEIVCGVFALEGAGTPPWFERLPSVVVSRGGGAERGWRTDIQAALRDEARAPTSGGSVIVNRLLESILADALGDEVTARTTDVPASASALTDRRIGAVLSRLHDALEEPWTVEHMAKVASMSRSAFADRFRSLLGLPPMHYLTELRLARSARLLSTTDITIAEIARRVGYGSEESLARAFRSRFGRTPGVYRRRRHALSRET